MESNLTKPSQSENQKIKKIEIGTESRNLQAYKKENAKFRYEIKKAKTTGKQQLQIYGTKLIKSQEDTPSHTSKKAAHTQNKTLIDPLQIGNHFGTE